MPSPSATVRAGPKVRAGIALVPSCGTGAAVTDTDAALAKVAELGGTVTKEATDNPHGRLAGATDPTGAAFKLVG